MGGPSCGWGCRALSRQTGLEAFEEWIGLEPDSLGPSLQRRPALVWDRSLARSAPRLTDRIPTSLGQAASTLPRAGRSPESVPVVSTAVPADRY